MLDLVSSPLFDMANFITCNQWPPRRIIGVILLLISLAVSPQSFAETIAYDTTGGGVVGFTLGTLVWGYILFRLLRAPDEAKTWKGIPHAAIAIALYFFIIFMMAASHYGKIPALPSSMDSRAQNADDCIRRKMDANEDMTTAAQDCMREVGMTEEEQKELFVRTLDMADEMTIKERTEWCKDFLPYFWDDPSTLDAACIYAAENWSEAKAKLLEGMDM